MTATQESTTCEPQVIAGDVEAAGGVIESSRDVAVEGVVRSGSTLRTSGALTVRGAVGAAIVEAGKDVQIDGGITGKRAGHIIAGKALTARFCDEADLQAGGDVVITTGGVVHSKIEAKGRILVEQGAVVGGSLYAREGAVIKTLGNDTQVRTQIAIGMHPEVLAAHGHMEKSQRKQRESVERIREMVKPLMANLKRLTPELRERATELMYQADGIEAQMQQESQKHAEALASYTPDGEPSLLVAERLYAGVVIVIGDRCVSIQQDRDGPVRFTRTAVRNKAEILLEEVNTSNTLTLVSAEYTPVTETKAGSTAAG